MDQNKNPFYPFHPWLSFSIWGENAHVFLGKEAQ